MQKTAYSSEELQEFKEIILSKIERAQEDLAISESILPMILIMEQRYCSLF